MLIRNILEESVRKFDEVKAVKWLKKKEIMERSYGELMENVVSTRKGLHCQKALMGKHNCTDRNQFCRVDGKLSGNHHRMYHCSTAGCRTSL